MPQNVFLLKAKGRPGGGGGEAARASLKDTAMRRILQKFVPHESLTLPFEPFRFFLRIRGDIRIWRKTPRYHRYGESPTPRITDTRSRRLPASLKENSLYRWYGESSTPRTSDTVSRRLPVSLRRGVNDSTYLDMESRWLPVSWSQRVEDSAYR